jgi:hypothetical protein
MAHDAGKGAKPRPYSISQADYTNNLGAIINNSRPDSLDDEDDDGDCKVCGGPMYTQPHWRYSYCDDCGASIKKEPMEP